MLEVTTRRISTAVLAIGLLLSCITTTVGAVETTRPENITMSPVKKRYDVKAGETLDDSFKIINDGQQGYTFIVYARPYSVKTENYLPDFTTQAPNADVYQWVQFDDSSYDLEPGESVDVGYTMRVPKSAAPGGHYGVLFAETQPKEGAEGNVVQRTKRVGAIVYANVDGKATTKGEAEEATISFFQLEPPLTATQRFKNTGNTDYDVEYNFTVSDLLGQKKYDFVSSSTILPNTTRKILMEWKDSPWFGLYKVDVSARYLDTSSSSSGYVLISPVWIYVVLVLVIGARVAYAIRQRKK